MQVSFRAFIRITALSLQVHRTHHRVVALGGLQQLVHLRVLIVRVGQILAGRSQAEGLDPGLSRLVAAVGAEAVMGDLRVQPSGAHLLQHRLDIRIILIVQPAREEPFAFDPLAGIAGLPAPGK